MKTKGISYNRTKASTYPAWADKRKYGEKYNTDMDNEESQDIHDFAAQLTSLRVSAGLSARELSLSLGQGPGYINNIENGKNFPSMRMFLEICRSLDISPAVFFGYCNDPGIREKRLSSVYNLLDEESQELLLALALKLRKKGDTK